MISSKNGLQEADLLFCSPFSQNHWLCKGRSTSRVMLPGKGKPCTALASRRRAQEKATFPFPRTPYPFRLSRWPGKTPSVSSFFPDRWRKLHLDCSFAFLDGVFMRFAPKTPSVFSFLPNRWRKLHLDCSFAFFRWSFQMFYAKNSIYFQISLR